MCWGGNTNITSNDNTQQRSELTEPQMNANKIQRRPRRQRRVGNITDRNSSICPGRSRPRKHNNCTLGTSCGNGSSSSKSSRRSSRTGNFRRRCSSNIFSSCSNMPSSIYLTLLAAVILGTDLTISDAEFLQQITTTKSAAVTPLENTTTTTVFKPTITTILSSTTVPHTVNTALIATTAVKAATLPISNTTLTVTTDSSSTLSTTHKTIISVLSQIPTKLLTHSLTTTSTTTTDASSTLPPTATKESNSLTFTSMVPSSTAPVAILEPPSSDSLTKGFSIPTFLPVFPAFSAKPAADTAMVPPPPQILSTSFSAEQLQQQQDQLYLDAYNKHHAPKKNLTIQETNVTVQVGSHAYMPCHIQRLMNKPVSWVRVRDGHILSVDQTTFIADQRFQSIFKGENEYTWSLQIKYVQHADEGWYECQVSTEPKMSAKVYLGVVVPKTELIGDQNRFVKAGSKVALHCIVRGTIEPPSYIIWYRGKTQIMNDNKMGWYTQIDRNIFGNSSEQQNTIGSLIIPFVRKKDSGNYTCQPSNSASVSVDLHVLSGEYSASAIMSAAATYKHNSCYILLILLFSALQKT